jgi:hypothetical protein
MRIVAEIWLFGEYDQAFSYYAAVSSAVSLVYCLAVLLTAIDESHRLAREKSERRLRELPPTDQATIIDTPDGQASGLNGAPERPRYSDSCLERRITGGAFFFASSTITFLFLSEFTNWNKIIIDPMSTAAALVSGLVGTRAYWCLLSQHPWPNWKSVNVTAVKEAFAITGIVFALYSGKTAVVAMTRSANSNNAAVNGQVAQSEARIDQDEANDPVITTMYYAPDWNDLPAWESNVAKAKQAVACGSCHVASSVTEMGVTDPSPETTFVKDMDRFAKAYWRARLSASVAAALKSTNQSASESAIYSFVNGDSCSTVENLTNFMFSADSAVLSAEEPHLPVIRAAFTRIQVHTVEIFNQLHLIDDYVEEKVIRRSDMDTWIGYTDDIGPHPVLCATLYNWLSRQYCTKEFYAEVEARLSGRKVLENALEEIENAKRDERDTIYRCEQLKIRLNNAKQGGTPLDKGFYLDAAFIFHRYCSPEKAKAGFNALIWMRVWKLYMEDSKRYAEFVDNLPLHDGPGRKHM